MQPIIGITPGYSYADNCYKIHEDYALAVSASGGQPVMLFPDMSFPKFIDGVILSGGGDVDPLIFGEQPIAQSGEISPIRDSFELPFCRIALNIGIPILGICRGMQILTLCTGGKIWQDIKTQTQSRLKHMQQAPRSYPTHTVTVENGTLLHRLTKSSSFSVNSYHHQALAETPEGFLVCAKSSDGLPEAIEHTTKPFVLGVQWHPEAMDTAEQKALFLGLVNAAASRKEGLK